MKGKNYMFKLLKKFMNILLTKMKLKIMYITLMEMILYHHHYQKRKKMNYLKDMKKVIKMLGIN